MIQSINRALKIFETVLHSDNGITLYELSKTMGLRATTTHNIVSTLVARGYLSKKVNPKVYVIGPSVLAITEAQNEQAFMRWSANAIVKLNSIFPDCTITIADVRSGDIKVVLRTSPEQPGVVQRPKQIILPPYSTVSSLVFLAYCSQDLREKYMQNYIFDEYGVSLWRNLGMLERYLNSVRKLGYAQIRYSKDVYLKVAVPLFSKSNELDGCLGISIPIIQGKDGKIKSSKVVKVLLGYCKQYSKYL